MAIVTGVKFLAILWAVGLAAVSTGCASSTGAKSVVSPTARPIKGDTVNQVLLSDGVLSKMLEQTFRTDPKWPPTFGGAEKLGRPVGRVSPPDCVSLALITAQPAYQTANVQNVANNYWWGVDTDGLAKVMSVSQGVVALPTAADATALFAKFSELWNKCAGQTVILDGGSVTFSSQISNVRVADSVLAATSPEEYKNTGTSAGVTIPKARSIGVRDNCLVEVEVGFAVLDGLSAKGTGDINTSAIQIAHAMMDKVSSLS